MLVPIRDDNPTIRKPYVTIGLIALNVLVFLYSRSLGAGGFNAFLAEFGFIPGLYFKASTLSPATDSAAYVVATGWNLTGTYLLTPISSMFLHGGFFHLGGNMLFLWIFGNNIEDYLGPVKFLIFYLIAGIVAVIVFSVANLESGVPLVGASGAIAGILGAYMVAYPNARVTCLLFFFFIQFVVLPAKIIIGIFFAFDVFKALTGTGGQVAVLAHVGGFVFGWLLFKVLSRFRGRGITPSGGQRVYKVQW